MTREIKFRALDTTGEWPCMIGPYDLGDSIFNHKEIITLPLMQFTGLKDKNGVEIYEGDILNVYSFEKLYRKVEVYYNSDYAIWQVRALPPYDFIDFEWICHHVQEKKYRELEIIGNIYEHPELLKP